MDDAAGVWMLGGDQSDFARNLAKEPRDFAAVTAEVVEGTLAAARVDAADIAATGVVHVANAFGEMFAGHSQLGAMPATVCDDLWDARPCGMRPRARPAAWPRSAPPPGRDRRRPAPATSGRRCAPSPSSTSPTRDTTPHAQTLTTDMNADASGPVSKIPLAESVSGGTHSTWAPRDQLRRGHTAESAGNATGL